MKKIPCVFQRNFSDKLRPILLREVTPGCEWVLAGEGIATRKWDGTAVLIRDGKLYARYDCKKGKTPPPGAIPCEADADPVTGHWPHWVEAIGPSYIYIRDAAIDASMRDDGTYEAVGPKINGNAHGLARHMLVRHGGDWIHPPLDFDGLRSFLAEHAYEGIVFHNAAGRMAKIRRDDFGLSWPVNHEAA